MSAEVLSKGGTGWSHVASAIHVPSHTDREVAELRHEVRSLRKQMREM